MVAYFSGCAALGLVAGFLVGGSTSPVVHIILPLLFAILGGGAGILGLTINPSSENAQQRFRLIGLAAFFVSVPFLFAAVYGSAIRTGSGIASFLPTWSKGSTEPILTDEIIFGVPVEDSLQIAIVDVDLKKIGLNADQRRKLIDQIVQNRYILVNFINKNKINLIEISGKIRKLIDSDDSNNFDSSADIIKLYFRLQILEEIVSPDSQTLSSSEIDAIKEVSKSLDLSELYSETTELYATHPSLAPLILELASIIRQMPSAELIGVDIREALTKTAERNSEVASTDQTDPPLFAIRD